MLDFEGGSEFEDRIRKHEAKIFKKYYGDGHPARISHNFKFACVLAADFILTKQRCRLENEECIADMFWGYNGRAKWHIDDTGKKSYRGSPYVWNDPKRGRQMVMRYRLNNGKIRTFPDTMAGAYIIYQEILSLGYSPI